MKLVAPQCWFCKHLNRKKSWKYDAHPDDAPHPIYGIPQTILRWKCDAYPDGIPQEILNWDVDHRQPYQGDHGIQFEPRTRKDAKIVDEQFKLFEEYRRQKDQKDKSQ